MCTVSMVAQDWTRRNPQFVPLITQPEISRVEFDLLKAELESIKKLLSAAKIYDTETGQKDCEEADKIALFRQLGKLLGVDMAEVFPEAK